MTKDDEALRVLTRAVNRAAKRNGSATRFTASEVRRHLNAAFADLVKRPRPRLMN
jgi:hypothetical protein